MTLVFVNFIVDLRQTTSDLLFLFEDYWICNYCCLCF